MSGNLTTQILNQHGTGAGSSQTGLDASAEKLLNKIPKPPKPPKATAAVGKRGKMKISAAQVVWELAGVKTAAFGDSVRGALGFDTEADKARRGAMIGAATLPFAGGAIGGGLGGGAEGALGGAAGQAAGTLGGGALGLLGGGALGALLLRGRARRHTAQAAEDALRQEGLWDATTDAVHRAFREAPFDDKFQASRAAAAAAEKAHLERELSPEELARISQLADAAALPAAAATGSVAGGLAGAYGGGIYGAGQGAAYGVDEW